MTTTTSQPAQVVPTKTSYVVDGQTVDLVCKGRGRVPVVFQAGGRAPGKIWDALIKSLGPDVFTCVYDRPGTVFDKYLTTSAPKNQTPRNVGNGLAQTLKQAGVGPRVILVGHSSGGVDSIVFGADHPDVVAGAVLFDPTSLVGFWPSDRVEWAKAGFDIDVAAQQVRDVKRWPDVPLEILSADPATQTAADGWKESDRTSWAAEAQRYAALSAHGTRTVVPGSPHHVFLYAPKVAAKAIEDVLAVTS